MTEYGPLTAYVEFQSDSNNAQTNFDQNVYSDDMYLSLGMLLAGRTASVYDYSGGFTINGTNYDSDHWADQVRLTWAMSGFGIQLAIEDPRDRWGSNLSTSYSMPNIVGNISFAQGHWSAQLSGGFAETTYGSGFGVQLGTTIKLDSIAPGDQLMLKAAWAGNQVWSFAASTGAVGASTGSIWSAAASFQHFWSPTLSSAVTWGYFSQSGGSKLNGNQVIGNLVWSPVTGFMAGVEGTYTKLSSSTSATWGVLVRLQRSW